MKYEKSENQEIVVCNGDKVIILLQHDYDRTIALYFGTEEQLTKRNAIHIDGVSGELKGFTASNTRNKESWSYKLSGEFFAKGDVFIGMDYMQGIDLEAMEDFPCEDLSELLRLNIARYNDKGHTLEDLINETIDAHNYHNLDLVDAPYYHKYQATQKANEIRYQALLTDNNQALGKIATMTDVSVAQSEEVSRLKGLLASRDADKEKDEMRDYIEELRREISQLKQRSIEEQNIALAEWCGFTRTKSDLGWYDKEGILNDAYGVKEGIVEIYEELLFDSDWRWIQAVVFKCWQHASALDIDDASMLADYKFWAVAEGHKEESYEAIVEFVENVGRQEPCVSAVIKE